MHSYERLLAWQRCHELTLQVYQTSRSWPATERYGLSAQIQQAAVSATANIVEGSVRRGPKEFGRFLQIASASLAEVGYMLLLAMELGYLNPEDGERVKGLHTEASRLTWKLRVKMTK
jgi:four helix bundle protein